MTEILSARISQNFQQVNIGIERSPKAIIPSIKVIQFVDRIAPALWIS